MLPFEPESIASLQARFHRALEPVWESENAHIDRPGLHREHVFDFESGLRLLISRDILSHGDEPHIHVSASWEHDIPNHLIIAHTIVEGQYHLLGGVGKLSFIGQSIKGIPHWVVRGAN